MIYKKGGQTMSYDVSIKITFITKEFLSIDFIENLLKQLDLRENLNQSNWRAERFAVYNSKEYTEWVLNNANLWYWYLSFYSHNEDLKFIINLDVRKEKLNETEIKEVVSEFDRMNKSVKIRKMK